MGIKRTTTIAKLKDWLILEARELRSLEIPKDTLKGTHPKVNEITLSIPTVGDC
jgi:hypothetical protein